MKYRDDRAVEGNPARRPQRVSRAVLAFVGFATVGGHRCTQCAENRQQWPPLRFRSVNRPRLLKALRARTIGTAPINWAERPPEDAWQAAIEGEVRFWREWLASEGARYPQSYQDRFNLDLPLQPDIAQLIDAPDGATVELLDVGAGPLTFLGRSHDRWTLAITAVDALGKQYSQLLDEAGITPPVRTQACESEKLTSMLCADSFDLVAARNTLDHSYDPVLAITQMVTCAKPGAAILLIHHENEAEREKYRGMHQWNFEAADSTLVVWRPGQRTDVGAELAGHAVLERVWTEGAWEHIVFRKN